MLNSHPSLSAAPEAQISPTDNSQSPAAALFGPSSVTHPLDPSAGHLRPTAVMVPCRRCRQPGDLLFPRLPPFSDYRAAELTAGLQGRSLACRPRLGHAPPPSPGALHRLLRPLGKTCPAPDTPFASCLAPPSTSVRVGVGRKATPPAHASASPRPSLTPASPTSPSSTEGPRLPDTPLRAARAASANYQSSSQALGYLTTLPPHRTPTYNPCCTPE